jgi:hypothetical protein
MASLGAPFGPVPLWSALVIVLIGAVAIVLARRRSA